MTSVHDAAPPLGELRGGWVRGGLRLLAIPLVTAACWMAWLAAGVGRGGAQRREALVRTWAQVMTRILNINIERLGDPPERPFLLVTNHLSYLDVMVLMTLVDAVFIAKREVRGWPMFGPLARIVGTIFIDRDSSRDTLRVAAAMSGALAAGRGVVLFAEGTSSDGSRVLPLRPALLDGAARSGWPVYVASLSYRTGPGDPPAAEVLCWWGDMTFLPHLAGVCRLRRSHARVAFGERPVLAADRRVLAGRLHEALTRSFVPSGHAN